jgi:predicted esterase
MRTVQWTLLFLATACTGGQIGDDKNNDDTDPDTDSDTDVRQGPAYSGGDCPTLKSGSNTGFVSGSHERDFRLILPDEPMGAPVLFAWHWLGGNADQMVEWSDFKDFPRDHGAIVISPQSRGLQVEWNTWDGDDSPDLVLFDDLLSCLWQQYDVDLDRIYASGMSAGALWTVTLSHYRSDWLAASAPLSGGATIENWEASELIPMLLTWGGPYDLYGTYSFQEGTLQLSDQLQTDGHFVAHCEHSDGHTLPPGGEEYLWTFFEAHPKGVTPEPWSNGLPSSMPDMCSLP